MKKRLSRFNRIVFLIVFALLLICTPSFAQDYRIPGKHRGAVTAVLSDNEGRLLSAGEDGFLTIWNRQAAVERYQLSPYTISAMVLRPGKPQIAIVESDGHRFNRISAWNYETKENLFTLPLRDYISYITYSAGGSFLIVAQSERSRTSLLDSDTGRLLQSESEFTSTITVAATGASERIMLAYLSLGLILYWDLEAGRELQHFAAPPGIRAGTLFGNNRFLVGFDSRGLLILDTTSGQLLARDENQHGDRIIISDPSSLQFTCLSFNDTTTPSATPEATLSWMEINLAGNLRTVHKRTVTPGRISSAAFADADTVLLGTDQGAIMALDGRSEWLLEYKEPEHIIDIAVSSSLISFITEQGTLGYIPLDYSALLEGDILTEDETPVLYTNISGTNISAAPQNQAGRIPDESRFLLWDTGRRTPMLKTLSGPPKNPHVTETLLDRFPLRSPLRTASLYGSNILFLDTAGMISVVNSESGNRFFSHSVPGSVDLAFVDENTIIIGRSAGAVNTPFMLVNIFTGETVNLPYPAIVGSRVYGGANSLYASALNQANGITRTSIIKIDTSNSANSTKLFDYDWEDYSLALAESGGNLAFSLGGRSAILKTTEERPLERSRGLPAKIIDGNRWFIILDRDGGISWHDNQTGNLQAMLRLYPGSWVLEKTAYFSFPGTVIQGRRETR